MSDEEQRRLAEWCVETCLMYGAEVATAYQVAAVFVAGVRAARERGER